MGDLRPLNPLTLVAFPAPPALPALATVLPLLLSGMPELLALPTDPATDAPPDVDGGKLCRCSLGVRFTCFIWWDGEGGICGYRCLLGVVGMDDEPAADAAPAADALPPLP